MATTTKLTTERREILDRFGRDWKGYRDHQPPRQIVVAGEPWVWAHNHSAMLAFPGEGAFAETPCETREVIEQLLAPLVTGGQASTVGEIVACAGNVPEESDTPKPKRKMWVCGQRVDANLLLHVLARVDGAVHVAGLDAPRYGVALHGEDWRAFVMGLTGDWYTGNEPRWPAPTHPEVPGED